MFVNPFGSGMANRRAFARTYDDWMPPPSPFARPHPTALTNPPVGTFSHPSRMANRSVAASPNPTRPANHRVPGYLDCDARANRTEQRRTKRSGVVEPERLIPSGPARWGSLV